MGPLAPYEIISENTNFLLAFFIGIAFGWVLESSGFSSSRKLAGMFYGYDTVVLKVFFTGAITAMLGLERGSGLLEEVLHSGCSAYLQLHGLG